MQTFLPYTNFGKCARVLDRARLGKQRVEVKQILRAMDSGGGWANHPATRMWRGHRKYLALYGCYMCAEWRRRGYQDSLFPEFAAIWNEESDLIAPGWMGMPSFHRSHRSNLLRKDPGHYGPLFLPAEPNLTPDLPYVWPV